ncbi:sulfatase family protein [Saccharicrinis aurantiacus]|uniref:sulfatase family protein n=1 Tax=Saccharicrinis aurantiacus TaxID=1849719 RepID=UPI00249140F2|nr:sulfatase [Saccharicrinis aurantiacus]
MKRIYIAILTLSLLLNVLSAQDRPNIVFLLSDDQTSAATGCYGNNQVITPNIDKMASEGVMFSNYYNTTSICMASRACLITGMYEYKTGCNFMHGPLHKDKFEKSFPVIMRKEGYFTGFAGKFGMAVSDGDSWDDKSWEVMPVDAYDRWGGGPGQTNYKTAKNERIAQYADEYPHSTRAYGAWANDFITDAKKSGKPFCMSISFKAPHLPFTPDKYFDDVYANKVFEKPANYGAENATHLSPQAKSGRQYNAYNFWRESEESYQKAMRTYNQLIHGVDYALGMIRKALEEQGVADNTIIIFTSDNGYSCGAHNFGGKVLPYEEASKSPCVIYDPRIPENKRGMKRETVAANIDIAPTILSYAGIKAPDNMDGKDLNLLINNPNKFKRETITLTNMWGNDEIQSISVVSKDWKYIYWQYENEKMKPTEELFFVGKDRLEMKNEVKNPEHKNQLNSMRQQYDKQVQEISKGAVNYNDYQKYSILFDRNASAEEKKPYLTGDYEQVLKEATQKRKEKQKQNKH